MNSRSSQATTAGSKDHQTHNKRSLQQMTVKELQAIVAHLEKQDTEYKRNLDRVVGQNQKLTSKITQLNKTNPDKQRRQKGSVSIQAPTDKEPAVKRGGRPSKSTGESEAAAGFVYVRKDRKQN